LGEEGVEQLRQPPVRGIESIDGVVVVQLSGELDLYNADQIRHALAGVAADNPDRVVVDLSDVEFIDSTALGVLIEARAGIENRDAFLLAAPREETRRALKVSGLDRHFGIHETVEGARAARL
jgi:anti-sigma B factor antagonist